MSIDSGAAAVCWICLEGGADEKGKPIVRDCACRGNDAGFAHFSCITKYAQQKSEQVNYQEDMDEFAIPWETCPNCRQNYQNDLSSKLSDAFVSFAERTYGNLGNPLEDKMKIMEALRLQIHTKKIVLAQTKKDGRHVMFEKLVRKLLKMVNQAKEEHAMDGWMHMPSTAIEFHHYRFICTFEAYGYYCLGEQYVFDTSEEGMNFEISYYKKARNIYKSIGSKSEAEQMTRRMHIARAKSKMDAVGLMKNQKQSYYKSLELYGENDERTLHAGGAYAGMLRFANFSIQAERLAMKLLATSRQVYGEDHKLTSGSLQTLNLCKKRNVHISSTESECNDLHTIQYEALRYENDGNNCIIFKDPSTDKGKARKTLSIAGALIIPAIGCPVICHGLTNASHLNGKLGDVRSFSFGSSRELRLGVYFEDESLKSAAVKPGNLRIAFVLPSV